MTTCVVVVFLLFVAICLSQATDPGVQMRVTQKGINYANTVAHDALAEALKTLKIPNQSGDDHHLSWSLSNIQVKGVDPPGTNIALNPGQNGLTLSLSGFSINLRTDWRVKYQKGWFKVSTSGSADIGVHQVTLTLTIGLGVDKDGRPSIAGKGCSANVGDVNIDFHGGTAFILNLFKGIVEDKVRDLLRSNICDLVVKEVNGDGEAALQKLKVNVEIDNRFLLDYSLVTLPYVTAQYLQTEHKGEAFWEADKKECPFSPGPIPALNESSSMLYLWLTEYTANTFTYTAQKNAFLRYNLTQNDLPAGNRSLLNTTCKTLCIGKLIPQIGEKYPNSVVELRINSTDVPKINMDGKMTGGVQGDMQFYAHTPDKKVVYLLTLNMTLGLTGKASIVNEKITGSIVDHNFKVGVVDSTVGDINPAALNIILNGALDLAVIPELNAIGKKGFDLPVTGGVKFLNTKLDILNGSLLVSTDVSYQQKDRDLKFQPAVIAV